MFILRGGLVGEGIGGAKVMHAELLETSFQEQFQIKAASLDVKGQLGCSMACLRVRVGSRLKANHFYWAD